MAESAPLSTNAQKVQDALRARGMTIQVVELPASTRTAQDAAQAIGCEVGQIVKSLVFRRQQSGQPVLVLASGANRVNEALIGAVLGEAIGKAEVDFVRKQTGFAIGGIPPLGHDHPMETLIDEDLLQYPQVWAAAGTPNAVFRMSASELELLNLGKVVQVK